MTVVSERSRQILILCSLISVGSCTEKPWTGKWFPFDPNAKVTETPIDRNNAIPSTEWKGKWFPGEPPKHDFNYESYEKDRIMGIPNSDCDDGETNLSVDFDPNSFEHSLSHTCLESSYKPNFDVEPIQTVHAVPTFYTPVHKCMNETITYDQKIPTLGYHRPLWAAYGEYMFLPPQRWLHNLEHGAIVALYHPCADLMFIEQLKALIKSCLYRHIITPYRELSSDYPFALAAWGTSLQFSVIDKPMLIEFIKKHAKTGPEKVSRNGLYKQMLTEASKTVTDVEDSELCPNVNVVM